MKNASYILTIIVLTLVCIFLSIITLVNTCLLLDSVINPDKGYISAFGYSPLVYGSKDGNFGIDEYDFLLIKNNVELQEGDIFAHLYGDVILVNKVMENIPNITTFILDKTTTIPQEAVIGLMIYIIPWLGRFLVFIKSLWGMFIFVGIPCILLILNEIYGEKILELVKEYFGINSNELLEERIPVEENNKDNFFNKYIRRKK